MRIRMPSRKVCERFYLTYELKGAQRGADVLTRYYRVRPMKIVLDGRKVSKNYSAEYSRNNSYFTKRGLTKRIVLHELYHHIVEAKGLEMPRTLEEFEANRFAREILKMGRRGL